MKNKEMAVLEFRLNSGAEEIIAFKEILEKNENIIDAIIEFYDIKKNNLLASTEEFETLLCVRFYLGILTLAEYAISSNEREEDIEKIINKFVSEDFDNDIKLISEKIKDTNKINEIKEAADSLKLTLLSDLASLNEEPIMPVMPSMESITGRKLDLSFDLFSPYPQMEISYNPYEILSKIIEFVSKDYSVGYDELINLFSKLKNNRYSDIRLIVDRFNELKDTSNDIHNKDINEDRAKLTWYGKLIKHLYSEFPEGDLPEYYSYKGKLKFKEE